MMENNTAVNDETSIDKVSEMKELCIIDSKIENDRALLDEFDPLKEKPKEQPLDQDQTKMQEPENQQLNEAEIKTDDTVKKPSEVEDHKEQVAVGVSKNKDKYQDVPPLDFDLFIQRLRHPSSYILVRFFKSFLKEFHKKKWSPEQQVKIISDFLEFITSQLKVTGLWKQEAEEVFEMAREGWEKLVTRKIYFDIFGHDADLNEDFKLKEKIFIHSWVNEKHLDISFLTGKNFEPFLLILSQEFVKMNEFKAPRDKIVCVINACRVIMSFLEQENMASADDFLPVLIFVLLKTSPQKIKSNLLFISRFRDPSKLQSEAGYYLTNLMGAVSFIENLTRESLTVDEAEYSQKVEEMKLKWEAENENLRKEIFEKKPLNNDSNLVHVKPNRTESAVSDILNEASSAEAESSSIFNPGKSRNLTPQRGRTSSTSSARSHTPDLVSHKPDQTDFLHELNDKDKELLGDYELQLAMALSMSVAEQEDELRKLKSDKN